LGRFAFTYPEHTTLASTVRNYSQPVNPRWFPDGDLHREKVASVEQSASLSNEERAGQIATLQMQAERRVRYAAERWGDLPAHIRDLIIDLLHGRIAPPESAITDFRAPIGGGGVEAAEAFAHRRGFVAVDATGNNFPAHGENWFFRKPLADTLRMELVPGPKAGEEQGSSSGPCSLPE
jgi:hypothetical protein